MRQGKVKWYNGKKCYGFVSPETPNESGNQDDVFIHSSSLQAAGIRFLNEGDVIKFDEEMRNGKLSVTTVELVSRDEESAKRFAERRTSFGGDRREGGERREGGFRGGDRREGGFRGNGERRDNRGERRGGGDDSKSGGGWGFWKK
jgi:cold shock CspA family protein